MRSVAGARSAAARREVSSQTAAERFDDLLRSIEPPADRMAKAAELPKIVREELEASKVLETVEPHTLLVGSYRRHTAIADIKDVDVAVLVAKRYASVEPREVLDDLEAAAKRAARRKCLRNIERHQQRRSIRCELPDDAFKLDLVPIVAVTGDPYGDLWIPDREWKKWLPTRSIGYVNTFSELNQRSGKKLVPLVKLIKHWRVAQGMDRTEAKSFWLEALVVQLFVEGAIDLTGSWPQIFSSTLEALHKRCLPVYNGGKNIPFVRDPMIATSDVAHNWSRDGFASFFQKLDASRKSASSALVADPTKAAALWRPVLGPEFSPIVWDWILPAAEATALGAAVGAVLVAAFDALRGKA
jgi:SMODS domain-containing protein